MHRDWFELGSRTLRAVLAERGREALLPTDEDWYLCPLCVDVVFTVSEFETKELSIEHVPPKALGGDEMVLTCRKCNNVAGSKFDAEAAKRENLMRFLAGRSGSLRL